MSELRVIFIGDVFGRPGRRAVCAKLGSLRSSFNPHFVVANGENAAGGRGITEQTANDLFDSGVDVLTLGNHSFANRQCYSFLNRDPRVIRPANYPPSKELPGRGFGVFEKDGFSLGIANIVGRVFMDAVDCPFLCADKIIEENKHLNIPILIDFHAEATSEKKAFANYLDGRIFAVVGTHTHVQTSDEVILPNGTAYITDAGMSGVADSIIGMDKSIIINKFITKLPNKFIVAEGDACVQGVLIKCNTETMLADQINRFIVFEKED
ncbi:MAG: TIGR00282 family metallophosphoesterase [Armatimonadota bacterium]